MKETQQNNAVKFFEVLIPTFALGLLFTVFIIYDSNFIPTESSFSSNFIIIITAIILLTVIYSRSKITLFNIKKNHFGSHSKKEKFLFNELSKYKKLNQELKHEIGNNEKKFLALKRQNVYQNQKDKLIESLKKEAEAEVTVFKQSQLAEAKLNAHREAKKIIINTIQRIGAEEAIENSISVFNIESDDVKGRIIGREGRNLEALEKFTGVEIIIDDTPEAIILSCFDPIKREIARLTLHKLVTDGRIHPIRIEEVVRKTQKQIEQDIIEIGKRTVIDLEINDLHPKLIELVGRMKYRSSYGQNLLQHSREVAKLCGIMSAELGLNPKLAKRAGLLHDIGKVHMFETDIETPHAILGMQYAKRFGENEKVYNAIGEHHNEIKLTTPLSAVVQICNNISASRLGARRQVLDTYLKRLKTLENIAYGFNGVKKAYALQAGRELKVIVENIKMDDSKAKELSFKISEKIKKEFSDSKPIQVTIVQDKKKHSKKL